MSDLGWKRVLICSSEISQLKKKNLFFFLRQTIFFLIPTLYSFRLIKYMLSPLKRALQRIFTPRPNPSTMSSPSPVTAAAADADAAQALAALNLTPEPSTTPTTPAKPTTAPQQPKLKPRKPQSHSDYLAQAAQYSLLGPPILTDTSLLTRDYSKATAKIDRQAFRNAVERAVYLREYGRALEMLERDEKGEAKVGPRERQELDVIRDVCVKALAQQ